MAYNPIPKGEGQDALDIAEAAIILNGTSYGFFSGLTLDRRRAEEVVNVISGTLRRRKPSEHEWRLEGVVLYENLKSLKELEDQRFQIVMVFRNPDADAPNNNKTSTLVVSDCRISDHSVSLSDGSTFTMNGRCNGWDIQ